MGHVRLFLMPNLFYQPAVHRVAGNNGGPLCPALQQRVPIGQVKLALHLFDTVAVSAFFDKNLPDVFLEQIQPLRHFLTVFGRIYGFGKQDSRRQNSRQ